LVETPIFVGMTHVSHLPGRAVLRVSGTDRVGFLNGLVSNDVAAVAPGRAVWAALLTPQGKYLADFFIFADGDTLLLDCAAAHTALIAQKLTRFRLRADVRIEPCDLAVFAAWGGTVPAGALVAADPRLPDAGWRMLARDVAANAAFEAWDAHRLRLGLPDGARDLDQEKTILLEAGFDELHGISWTKGCYMGQELTARTRYRGLIKRRLLPVRGDAPLGDTRQPVTSAGREVGELRSVLGDRALAVLRLDSLGGALEVGGVGLTVEVPGWARLEAAV
jgi:folate-binding protein YgfZ